MKRELPIFRFESLQKFHTSPVVGRDEVYLFGLKFLYGDEIFDIHFISSKHPESSLLNIGNTDY